MAKEEAEQLAVNSLKTGLAQFGVECVLSRCKCRHSHPGKHTSFTERTLEHV